MDGEKNARENRIVAKSRPMVMNLTSSVATSSSSVNSPIASRSPGILKSFKSQGWIFREAWCNHKSKFQSRRWQRDAQLFISTGKLVAAEHRGFSGNPEIPEGSEDSELNSRIWPHHFRISPDCVPHVEKVFSIVRKINDRKPTDDLDDLDVNAAIWGVFMSVTLQAAVHLGRDCLQNLRSVKNQSSKSVDQLFRTTEKLLKEQTEITGLCTIDWNQPVWRESSQLCDRAMRILKSETYVFSDSVQCLGGISTEPVQAWKDKIKWCLETRHLKELDRRFLQRIRSRLC